MAGKVPDPMMNGRLPSSMYLYDSEGPRWKRSPRMRNVVCWAETVCYGLSVELYNKALHYVIIKAANCDSISQGNVRVSDQSVLRFRSRPVPQWLALQCSDILSPGSKANICWLAGEGQLPRGEEGGCREEKELQPSLPPLMDPCPAQRSSSL